MSHTVVLATHAAAPAPPFTPKPLVKTPAWMNGEYKAVRTPTGAKVGIAVHCRGSVYIAQHTNEAQVAMAHMRNNKPLFEFRWPT